MRAVILTLALLNLLVIGKLGLDGVFARTYARPVATYAIHPAAYALRPGDTPPANPAVIDPAIVARIAADCTERMYDDLARPAIAMLALSALTLGFLGLRKRAPAAPAAP